MRAVVFVGPTIPVADVHRILDAECLPPVAQGDVYRAALRRPRLIGIIDGYFDGVPSVWHKEILWAMAEGIQVFGSASMGALRAAELADFGMRGVGRIYDDYRSGRLLDDDEVAVLHAPPELGFAPLSEPMVSIRATVERAQAEGVLHGDVAAGLIGLAKAMHYRDRSWEAVLKAAANSNPQLPAFRDWLASGRVDAKREDAVAMLQAMAAAGGGEDAAAAGYNFERTHVWDDLARRVEAAGVATDPEALLVIEELRLDPDRYERLRQRAALRGLAVDAARRDGAEPDRRALAETMGRHRGENRLARRSDLAAWLDRNGLDEADYEALVTESHLAAAGSDLPPDALSRHLVAELKWTGTFAGLRDRAAAKARALGNGGPAPAGPERLRAVVWYFEERLGRAVPDDLDGHARTLGLEGRDELCRILEREYLYWRSGAEGGRPG